MRPVGNGFFVGGWVDEIIAIGGKPAVRTDWNFNISVAMVKPVLGRWKKEARDMVIPELWNAYVHLASRGILKSPIDGKILTPNRDIRTFTDYCDAIGITRQTGRNWLLAVGLVETKRSLPLPDSIFLYNIWSQQGGDGKEFFGHFPERFMRNLLYYHTNEDDRVFDPFAGSGTTIDCCHAMAREAFCYDINPVRQDIRQHDITTGLPANLPRIDLAFLDPPYWKQAAGRYGEEPNNLGDMDLNMFNGVMSMLFGWLANKKVPTIALVIQPTQYANQFEWVDHIFDFAKMLPEYRITMRYVLPYSTHQYNAQMAEKAKETNHCLCLNRDLVVWGIR